MTYYDYFLGVSFLKKILFLIIPNVFVAVFSAFLSSFFQRILATLRGLVSLTAALEEQEKTFKANCKVYGFFHSLIKRRTCVKFACLYV